MQRDLTDSTVLRNIGVPMAHSVIAMQSLLKGLNKVILNREAFDRDLENNWAVVAEGIQTILRREGYPKPYEALKALTRTNTHVTEASIAAFIDGLDVAETVKAELRALTPATYEACSARKNNAAPCTASFGNYWFRPHSPCWDACFCRDTARD